MCAFSLRSRIDRYLFSQCNFGPGKRFNRTAKHSRYVLARRGLMRARQTSLTAHMGPLKRRRAQPFNDKVVGDVRQRYIHSLQFFIWLLINFLSLRLIKFLLWNKILYHYFILFSSLFLYLFIFYIHLYLCIYVAAFFLYFLFFILLYFTTAMIIKINTRRLRCFPHCYIYLCKHFILSIYLYIHIYVYICIFFITFISWFISS